MKRTMFYKCMNCNKSIEFDHPVKSLSKTHNKGEIFIDDDAKIMSHKCDPKSNITVGIAYLYRVDEID